MNRTDEQIKRDVVDQLFWDSSVNAAEVKVEVFGGKVTLTGNVFSFRARESALRDALYVKDVIEVENLLHVGFPEDYLPPTDDEIQQNAALLLKWHSDLDGADIKVTVVSGKVNLTGTVDTYWRKYKASQLVAELRGVKDILNMITVVPTDKYVDKSIALEIEKAMERHPNIEPGQITVQVANGLVTLTGIVGSAGPRWAAYDIAAYTLGVVEIDNKIVINN